MARQKSDRSEPPGLDFREWCEQWLRERGEFPLTVDLQLPDNLSAGKELSIVLRPLEDPPRNPKGNVLPLCLVKEVLTEETASELLEVVGQLTGGDSSLERDAFGYLALWWATLQDYLRAARGQPSRMPSKSSKRFDLSRSDGKKQWDKALNEPVAVLNQILELSPNGLSLPSSIQGRYSTIPAGRLFSGDNPDQDAELYPGPDAGFPQEMLDELVLVMRKEFRDGATPIAGLPTRNGDPIEVSDKELRDGPQNAFERKGAAWQIVYEGHELNPLKDLDGLHYIAMCLDKPGDKLNPTEMKRGAGRLVWHEKQHPSSAEQKATVKEKGHHAQTAFPRPATVNGTAAAEYEKALKQVQGEIKEIAGWVEEARSSSLSPAAEERLEQLKDHEIQLKKQLKQHGIEKKRSDIPSNSRLAGDANAVTAAITAARREIAKEDLALAQHLERNMERQDYMFWYEPDQEKPVEWSVSL